MKRSVLFAAMMLAIAVSTAALPKSAGAMTIAAPLGVSRAVDEVSQVEQIRWGGGWGRGWGAGARLRKSVLGDICEAVIGAVFLVIAILISLGAVIGRYHYALDVIMGALTALIVFAASYRYL